MKKQNKGITLVALVITIIVLIILAGVSINAVMNDGLIGNSKLSKSRYDEAKEQEEKELSQLEIADKEIEFLTQGIPYAYKNGYIQGENDEKIKVGYITGIKVGTKVSEFKASFPAEYKMYYYGQVGGENLELDGDLAVATGMVLTDENGEEIGITIVFGDVAGQEITGTDGKVYPVGDGEVEGVDSSVTQQVLANTMERKPEYRVVAMDINLDGIVDFSDADIMLEYGVGLTDIGHVYARDIENLIIKDYAYERKAYVGKLSYDLQKLFTFNEEEHMYIFTGAKSGDTVSKWVYPKEGGLPEKLVIRRGTGRKQTTLAETEPIQADDYICIQYYDEETEKDAYFTIAKIAI